MTHNPYRGHRFPREVISYAVWFYYRFAVSFRDVQEVMASRGVLVTYETIRRWCGKFGKQYVDGLRRRRARTGDKWHLDEVFLKINGSLTTSGEPSIRTGSSWTFLCNQSGPVCRHQVLSQAVAGHRKRTTCDHNRQTAQLRRRETGDNAGRCSSTTSIPEQPGGELTSADT